MTDSKPGNLAIMADDMISLAQAIKAAAARQAITQERLNIAIDSLQKIADQVTPLGPSGPTARDYARATLYRITDV